MQLEQYRVGLKRVDGLVALNKNKIDALHNKIHLLKEKIGETREMAQQVRTKRERGRG